MIYIELIELKFCRLDYHLKKKIEERGIKDAKLYLDENDEDNSDDNNDNGYSKDPINDNDGNNSSEIYI